MPKYLIERELPGAGQLSQEQLTWQRLTEAIALILQTAE